MLHELETKWYSRRTANPSDRSTMCALCVGQMDAVAIKLESEIGRIQTARTANTKARGEESESVINMNRLILFFFFELFVQ